MLKIGNTCYVKEKEVSRLCGLSSSWFSNARSKGTGPKYHVLNRKVYYVPEEVELWLKENLRTVEKWDKN